MSSRDQPHSKSRQIATTPLLCVFFRWGAREQNNIESTNLVVCVYYRMNLMEHPRVPRNAQGSNEYLTLGSIRDQWLT